jgi:hypothetical protein
MNNEQSEDQAAQGWDFITKEQQAADHAQLLLLQKALYDRCENLHCDREPIRRGRPRGDHPCEGCADIMSDINALNGADTLNTDSLDVLHQLPF